MARGANFKIGGGGGGAGGGSSDRHNFRDFEGAFIQPETHLAITNPDHQTKDMIVLLGDRAEGLSASNCRGFQKKVHRQLKNEYRKSCKERGVKMAGNAKLTLEANINLEEWHTKADLERLVSRLEKELNVEMLYLVAHFDEGHKDKTTGEIKINSHAHFKFTPLVDGKITRRDKAWARKSQDICAEALGMERGTPVEISGRKGLGHKAYRQSKRDQDALIEKLTTEINEPILFDSETFEVNRPKDIHNAKISAEKIAEKIAAADLGITTKIKNDGQSLATPKNELRPIVLEYWAPKNLVKLAKYALKKLFAQPQAQPQAQPDPTIEQQHKAELRHRDQMYNALHASRKRAQEEANQERERAQKAEIKLLNQTAEIHKLNAQIRELMKANSALAAQVGAVKTTQADYKRLKQAKDAEDLEAMEAALKAEQERNEGLLEQQKADKQSEPVPKKRGR